MELFKDIADQAFTSCTLLFTSCTSKNTSMDKNTPFTEHPLFLNDYFIRVSYSKIAIQKYVFLILKYLFHSRFTDYSSYSGITILKYETYSRITIMEQDTLME